MKAHGNKSEYELFHSICSFFYVRLKIFASTKLVYVTFPTCLFLLDMSILKALISTGKRSLPNFLLSVSTFVNF